MKNKNGSALIIVLISLVIILSATLSYFIFFKDSNKSSSKDNAKSSAKTKDNTKKDDDNKNITEEEINDMVDIIGKYYLRPLSWYGEDKKFNDKVDQLMLYLMYSYMVSVDQKAWTNHFDNNSKWSFTKEKADKYFKKVYNITPKKYEDILCPGDNEVLVIYDDINEEFIFDDNHPGHGLSPIDFMDYYVVSSSKKNNIYTLTLIFLYGNEMDGFYVNDKELSVDFGDSYQEPEDYIKAYKNYFKKNIDKYLKGIKYTYVFEKKDNNYFVKEFKLEK